MKTANPRRPSFVFLLPLALLALSGPASADELRLHDGRVLVGKVAEKGERLEVTTRDGIVALAKKDVSSSAPGLNADDAAAALVGAATAAATGAVGTAVAPAPPPQPHPLVAAAPPSAPTGTASTYSACCRINLPLSPFALLVFIVPAASTELTPAPLAQLDPRALY